MAIDTFEVPAPQAELEPDPIPQPEPEPEPEPAAISGPQIRRLPKRLVDFQISSRSELMIRQLQRPPSPSPEPVQPAVPIQPV